MKQYDEDELKAKLKKIESDCEIEEVNVWKSVAINVIVFFVFVIIFFAGKAAVRQFFH